MSRASPIRPPSARDEAERSPELDELAMVHGNATQYADQRLTRTFATATQGYAHTERAINMLITWVRKRASQDPSYRGTLDIGADIVLKTVEEFDERMVKLMMWWALEYPNEDARKIVVRCLAETKSWPMPVIAAQQAAGRGADRATRVEAVLAGVARRDDGRGR